MKNKPSLLTPAGNFVKRLSQPNSKFRQRIFRFGGWSLGLFFLYSFMSGTYGIPRIVRLKMEKESLIQANRIQTVNLIDSERRRNRLRYDLHYIEYIARTRYHMAAPDETIYRYRGH